MILERWSKSLKTCGGNRGKEDVSRQVKREDVLVDGKKLKVEDGKGGKRRYVPLNGTARAVLGRLFSRNGSEYLFHDKNGKPFKDIKKAFISAVERAGTGKP